MDWRQADDRVFVVRCEREGALSPLHQVELIDALRASTQRGATALLFDLRVARLSADVLNRWVEVVVELGAALTHVGMITQSTSLRAMSGAFSLAVGQHRRGLAVEVFADEASALAWASRGERHSNL